MNTQNTYKTWLNQDELNAIAIGAVSKQRPNETDIGYKRRIQDTLKTKPQNTHKTRWDKPTWSERKEKQIPAKYRTKPQTASDPQLDSTLDPRRQAIRAAELTRSGGTNDRSLYLECKAELERVKADAEYWQKHHDALQRAMNAARQRENALQAEKGELLAALNTAADWFARSTRIDDLEQVEDMRAAISKHEGGNQ